MDLFLSYNNFKNKINFITHFTIVCFNLALLLYGEQIFGIQMVLVSLKYTQRVEIVNNKKIVTNEVSETFKLLVVLLSALANFIASNDHTTLCINAIYSIVFLFIVIAQGTFYIHLQREKSLIKTKLNLIQNLLCYLLLIIIIVADCFYYNYENKQWFLISCFFIYLAQTWKLLKLLVYLLGFLVCLLLNTTLYYWLTYTIFVICVIAIAYAREHYSKDEKGTPHISF